MNIDYIFEFGLDIRNQNMIQVLDNARELFLIVLGVVMVLRL